MISTPLSTWSVENLDNSAESPIHWNPNARTEYSFIATNCFKSSSGVMMSGTLFTPELQILDQTVPEEILSRSEGVSYMIKQIRFRKKTGRKFVSTPPVGSQAGRQVREMREMDALALSVDVERLRQEFQANIPIRDRRYLLRTFKRCFVGEEAVAWFQKSGWARTTEEAVALGCILQQRGVFDHVTGAHRFGNKYLFYHFTKERECAVSLISLQYRLEYALPSFGVSSYTALARKVSCLSQLIETYRVRYFESFVKIPHQEHPVERCNRALQLFKASPHDGLSPLESWGVTDSHAIFVSKAMPGLPYLLGLKRYYQYQQASQGEITPLFLYNAIRRTMKDIVGALLHLHQVGAAYGRLCNSNIVFASDQIDCMQVQLIDVGCAIFSRYFSSNEGLQLSAPSPEAMLIRGEVVSPNSSAPTSPRVIRTSAPTRADDSWAIGVLLYVLLIGELPYPWNPKDQQSFIINELLPCGIEEEQMNNPDNLITSSARDLILQLLRLNAKDRMSVKNVLEHSFFSESDDEIMECYSRDWEHVSHRVCSRYDACWSATQGRRAFMPPTVSSRERVSPLAVSPAWHLLAPFQTYATLPQRHLPAMSIRRVSILALSDEELDSFFIRLAAEAFTVNKCEQLGKQRELLQHQIAFPQTHVRENPFGEDVTLLSPNCNAFPFLVPSEIPWTYGDSTFHFVRTQERWKDWGDHQIPLELLHATCAVLVTEYADQAKMDTLVDRYQAIFGKSTSLGFYTVPLCVSVLVVVMGCQSRDVNMLRKVLSRHSGGRTVSVMAVPLPLESISLLSILAHTLLPQARTSSMMEQYSGFDVCNGSISLDLQKYLRGQSESGPPVIISRSQPTRVPSDSFQSFLETIRIHERVLPRVIHIAGCDFLTTQWDEFLMILPAVVNQGLHHIQITQCPLGDKATADLANMLTGTTQDCLLVLILVDVGCGPRGAAALGQYLRKPLCSLRTLDLSENELLGTGASSLLEGVIGNTSLRTLRLYNTAMTSPSLFPMADMIRRNKTLTSLNVAHNPFDCWALVTIENALRHNDTLTQLRYDTTQLRQHQHHAILRRLALNQKLREMRERSGSSFSVVPVSGVNPQSGLTAYGSPAVRESEFPLSVLQQLQFPIQQLVLTHLKLESVPPLSGLPHLTLLTLAHNELTSYEVVDERMAQQLIEVDLSFNCLSCVPSNLQTHINLTSLNLSSNHLDCMADLMGLVDMPKLSTLLLSNNWLNSVPLDDFSSSFTPFDRFSLSGNAMSPLKSAIYENFFLRRLTLDLSDRYLHTLPHDFSYLSHLRRLNLARNPMNELPPQLKSLTQLQQVLFHDQILTPAGTSDVDQCGPLLPLQKKPSLVLNPLSLEAKVASRLKVLRTNSQPAPPHPANWVESKASSTSSVMPPIQECPRETRGKSVKVIHVGASNSAASYIFAYYTSLCNKEPVHNTDHNYVCFCQCQKPHHATRHVRVTINPLETTQFEMWDLCGKESLQIQFFPAKEAIYVVYYNQAKPLNQVIRQLQIIHSSCEQPYVILAGYSPSRVSGIELSPAELSQQLDDLQERGFQSIRFLHTLEKNRHSAEELSQSLVSLVQQNPALTVTLSTQEQQLIHMLESETTFMTPPILNLRSLSSIAESCDHERYADPKSIARHLNRVGAVLYMDELRLGLSDTVILSRDWAVHSCTELFLNQTELKDGVFHLEDLERIWKPPCYPKRFLETIKGLLIKYEIACEIDSCTLLVPQKMPAAKPVLFDLWPSLSDYLRRYQLNDHPQAELARALSFYPRGPPHNFLSRLIVRLFQHGKAVRYWKGGLLLQRSGHLCLVEMCSQMVVHLCFRPAVPGDTASVSSFIRAVMETTRQLADSYRVPYESNVAYLCPSVGIETRIHRTEAAVYQDMLAGNFFVLGPDEGERIFYRDIAPDLTLQDMKDIILDAQQLTKGDVLGEGAFGKVYRGYYGPEKKQVAVKELLHVDWQTLQVLGREVWMLRTMNHRAIAGLVGYSWEPLELALELVPHGDLYSFLHNPDNQISWPFRFKMALDIAEAMAYLHSQDPIVVHRDLKTPNCLLAGLSEKEEVTVKVTDLGEAILLTQAYVGRDNLQNPVWMAPEILRNESYDQSSDVYSYGIVLWELLERKLPFSEFEVANTPFKSQLEDAIVDGLRPTIPFDCPLPYATLMMDCWQNESRLRPSFAQIVLRLQEMQLTVPSE